MKYEIVIADSPDQLVTDVQDWLDQGWEPTGGMCILPSPNFQIIEITHKYFQSIVKKN